MNGLVRQPKETAARSEDRPEITLPPTVQTWLPGNPVIPGARWNWDTARWENTP